MPQPVLAEIAYGLERLPSSRRRRSLEARFRSIAEGIARAPWTDSVSEHFGAIKAALERAGNRVDDFDLAIAAHALAHDCVLVIDNARHFRRIAKLRLETWA